MAWCAKCQLKVRPVNREDGKYEPALEHPTARPGLCVDWEGSGPGFRDGCFMLARDVELYRRQQCEQITRT